MAGYKDPYAKFGQSARRAVLNAPYEALRATTGFIDKKIGKPVSGVIKGVAGLPEEGILGAASSAIPSAEAAETPAHQRSGILPIPGRSPMDAEANQDTEAALNDPASGNPNRSTMKTPDGSVQMQALAGKPGSVETSSGQAGVQSRGAFGENLYARGRGGRLNDFTNVVDAQGQPQFAGNDAMGRHQAGAAYGQPKSSIGPEATAKFADNPFMADAEKQAMSDSPAEYQGGRPYGAPGSSGMPGPGGTVNTISSEAFTGVGGRAAGDAAVGRARRDFMLRQEGNAHLASDATPAEVRAGKKQEIRQEMQNLDLGIGQSFGSLAKNKRKARMLNEELGNIRREEELGMAQETARAEHQFKARENKLDRASEERQAVIKQTLGGLPSGRTEEAVKNKMVTEGWDSLSPEEQYLMEQDIRKTLVEKSLVELSQDDLQKQVDLIMGQLGARGGGRRNTGKTLDGASVKLPEQAVSALEKAYEADPANPEPVILQSSEGEPTYWVLDPETQQPTQVEKPR